MLVVRLISLSIRLAALAWSLRLVHTARDRRCLLLTLLLALMSARSAAAVFETPAGAVSTIVPRPLVALGLVELAVSSVSFGVVFSLEQIMRARRRTEAALRESEERFRLLAENVPGVIYLCRNDARYTMLYLNDAVEELTGYPKGEFLGDRISYAELFHPDDAARVRADVDAGLAAGRSFRSSYRLRHRSGKWRWVEEMGVGVMHGDELAYLEGFLKDVTEQRRVEEAARAAQRQLVEHHEREAERVAAELAKARDELVRQTRLATIGRVSAQIAHEVRNPLACIRNSCFYLRRKLPPDEAKWHEHLHGIEREIAACDRIIESLLDATRLKPPRRETFDLCAVLHDLAARLERSAGVTVQVVCVPNTVPVHADRVQLGQVIGNLLENARDAVGAAGAIRVELSRADAADILRIRDTGPGVPPEERERIFELLFTTKVKGTGLGLALCRQIIEAHGGTLQLADPDGPGATFEIRLPRNSNDRAGEAPAEPFS